VSKRDAPLDVNDLIRAVRNKTRSCNELERLDVAVEYGELVKDIGDQLVGHFVEQARRAGASWAQVGERLGVTKQAAHQRHVRRTPRLFDRPSRSSGQGPFDRFVKEARDVVVASQEEARSLWHNYVGVEHLLLALSEDGIVGPLLRAAGAPRDAILEQVRSIVGEGGEAPAGTIPFTPRAKRALELAARAANQSGRRVGPADILIGALDIRQGVGAAVLDALGVSRDELRREARAGQPGDD
jgi:hypothetical protein